MIMILENINNEQPIAHPRGWAMVFFIVNSKSALCFTFVIVLLYRVDHILVRLDWNKSQWYCVLSWMLLMSLTLYVLNFSLKFIEILHALCPSQPSIINFNTLRRRLNGRHFPDNIFRCISCMKMYEFRLWFLWSLFLRAQFIIFQHWFR